jgi:TolA-binding protein
MMRGATIVVGLLLIGSCAMPAEADPNARRALKTANGLLERGLAAEAIPEYRAAIDGLERRDALNEARYGLALSLFRTGAHDATLEALGQIDEESPFDFSADAALLRAHALHRTGRYEDAADAFVLFTEAVPDHGGWASAAALAVECASRAGDHRQAVRLVRRFEDRLGDSDAGRRAVFFAAVSQSARGRHADAATSFERLARGDAADPLTDQAMLRLARSLERLGRRGEALRRYESASRSASVGVRRDAVIGLASMLREGGEAERAGEMLAALRKEAPDHRPERVSLELGLTELDLGRPDTASALFDRIEKTTALLDDAAYWRARAESESGEHRLAARRLARAIESFPESPLRPRMLYDLGVALDQAGEDGAARDAFVSFREAYPEHALAPEALHAEATLLLDAGDLDGAADRAAAMLGAHADHPRALETAFVLGEAEYRRGRTGRAAEVFAGLLVLAESSPDRDPGLVARTRYRLGMSLHAEGRDEEATPHLRAVIDGEGTEARFAPALGALGDAAFAAGDWGEAVEFLGTYLLTKTGETARRDDAAMRLGLALARLDRHGDALDVFDELASGGGAHAVHASFEAGQCLVAMGREGEAEARFERVLSEHAGSRFEGHALRYLGSIAMQRGDSAGAEAFLARAGEHLGTDPSVVVDRVRALLELGRASDAVDVLGSRERGEPPERSGWRVVALARDGRHRDAVRALEALDPEGIDASLLAMAEFEASRSLRAVGRDGDAEGIFRRLAGSGEGVASHSAVELASILSEREAFDEARTVLAACLGSSDLPDALCRSAVYRSAWASHRLGDHEAVIALLDPERRRCDLGPTTPSAELLYGEALLATGRPREAAVRFAIVTERFGDTDEASTALLRLGDSHAAAQSWGESRRAYSAFLRSHAESPLWFRARFGLGWSVENGGDPEAAIEHYRLVTDEHRGGTAARAQFQIGECLFALGRHDEAVRELLRVDILYAEPEWSAAAVYEAGRCFEAMGKVGEARAQYRDVAERFGESDWARAAGERLAALRRGRVPGRGGDG